MCPICLSNLALIAMGVTSTTGLAALASRNMRALSGAKGCGKPTSLKRNHL